jgi:hypothetical protein
MHPGRRKRSNRRRLARNRAEFLFSPKQPCIKRLRKDKFCKSAPILTAYPKTGTGTLKEGPSPGFLDRL